MLMWNLSKPNSSIFFGCIKNTDYFHNFYIFVNRLEAINTFQDDQAPYDSIAGRSGALKNEWTAVTFSQES